MIGAVFVGCGGGPGSLSEHTGSNQGGGAPSGGDGAGDPGDPGGFVGSGGNTGGYGQGGVEEACAGTSVKAEVVPLDMYVLLDRSGSMADLTGPSSNGPSKWAAVTTALSVFFSDPGSAALGVGLQFFPVSVPDVPDTCSSSVECGAAAPCFLHACELAMMGGEVLACDADSDCPPIDTCAPLGVCANDSGFVCLYQTPEVSCGSGLGKCVQLTHSFCVNKDSCVTEDYAAPAVEIALLAGSSQALTDAIAGHAPGGATPTAPALSGAIEHVKAWAEAHPSREVVAVIATDGLPTVCEPQSIGAIANIAEAGQSGGVLTFVIGVFAQGDVGAQQNLDEIAQSGGTGEAFFITSNQDVTQGFLAALQAIQKKTLACDYQLPAPVDGSDLDFWEVNVAHTPSGESGPHTLLYVGDAAGCDPVDGGWYYDVDPKGGGVPTKIVMCASTCGELEVLGGQVDIEMGCQTIVAEPK